MTTPDTNETPTTAPITDTPPGPWSTEAARDVARDVVSRFAQSSMTPHLYKLIDLGELDTPKGFRVVVQEHIAMPLFFENKSNSPQGFVEEQIAEVQRRAAASAVPLPAASVITAQSSHLEIRDWLAAEGLDPKALTVDVLSYVGSRFMEGTSQSDVFEEVSRLSAEQLAEKVAPLRIARLLGYAEPPVGDRGITDDWIASLLVMSRNGASDDVLLAEIRKLAAPAPSYTAADGTVFPQSSATHTFGGRLRSDVARAALDEVKRAAAEEPPRVGDVAIDPRGRRYKIVNIEGVASVAKDEETGVLDGTRLSLMVPSNGWKIERAAAPVLSIAWPEKKEAPAGTFARALDGTVEEMARSLLPPLAIDTPVAAEISAAAVAHVEPEEDLAEMDVRDLKQASVSRTKLVEDSGVAIWHLSVEGWDTACRTWGPNDRRTVIPGHVTCEGCKAKMAEPVKPSKLIDAARREMGAAIKRGDHLEIPGIVARVTRGMHRQIAESVLAGEGLPSLSKLREIVERNETAREIRPAVLLFAAAMEQKLRENDEKKGGWGDESESFLLGRLREETDELDREIERFHRANAAFMRCEERADPNARARDVRREAADVANLAMMLADNAGDLRDGFDPIAEMPARVRTEADRGGAWPLSDRPESRAEPDPGPWKPSPLTAPMVDVEPVLEHAVKTGMSADGVIALLTMQIREDRKRAMKIAERTSTPFRVIKDVSPAASSTMRQMDDDELRVHRAAIAPLTNYLAEHHIDAVKGTEHAAVTALRLLQQHDGGGPVDTSLALTVGRVVIAGTKTSGGTLTVYVPERITPKMLEEMRDVIDRHVAVPSPVNVIRVETVPAHPDRGTVAMHQSPAAEARRIHIRGARCTCGLGEAGSECEHKREIMQSIPFPPGRPSEPSRAVFTLTGYRPGPVDLAKLAAGGTLVVRVMTVIDRPAVAGIVETQLEVDASDWIPGRVAQRLRQTLHVITPSPAEKKGGAA